MKGPNTFVSVYERASGTPIWADAIRSGFGETVAPRIDAVSVNAAFSASEVRLASTVTSQTPAIGFVVVRLVGEPVVQLPADGL